MQRFSSLFPTSLALRAPLTSTVEPSLLYRQRKLTLSHLFSSLFPPCSEIGVSTAPTRPTKCLRVDLQGHHGLSLIRRITGPGGQKLSWQEQTSTKSSKSTSRSVEFRSFVCAVHIATTMARHSALRPQIPWHRSPRFVCSKQELVRR